MKLIISKKMLLSLVLMAAVQTGFTQVSGLEEIIEVENKFQIAAKAQFNALATKKSNIDNKAATLLFLSTQIRDTIFDCKRPEETKPIRLGKLNEIDYQIQDVTHDNGLDLSLFNLIKGKLGRKDKLTELKFLLYKDFPCTPSSTRVMAGFSVNFVSSGKNIELDTLKFKQLALSGKLKKSKITYKTHYYGLCEILDYNELSPSGTLTAESLTAIFVLADKLRKALNKNTIVDPVVWPEYGALQAKLSIK